MKTRIIAAAVLVPGLFLLVLVAPEIVAAVVFSALMALARMNCCTERVLFAIPGW